MAALVELARTPGVLYADCGGVWVMILHRPPTAQDMRGARAALEAMTASHPKGFASLTWVLESAGFSMGADARAAATEVTRAFAHVNVAEATVIEGSGFFAAAVRAVITGLHAMARTNSVKGTFGDLREAAAWCVERRPTPQGPSANAITAALLAARAQLARA